MHVVQRGETLPSIAGRYGVTVDELRRTNKIGRLQAGQQLLIKRAVASTPKKQVRRPPPKRRVGAKR